MHVLQHNLGVDLSRLLQSSRSAATVAGDDYIVHLTSGLPLLFALSSWLSLHMTDVKHFYHSKFAYRVTLIIDNSINLKIVYVI